jgi:cation diffusion facilitator family transporter
MADIFGSLVVWGGLRISAQPPDERHPYGHGKAEALSAFIVACMLIVAAIGIAVAAVREIITPHHSPAAFTLWVLLGVVIVKETLFRFGRRAHDESGSGAVLADAWHHRSDALTSLAAAIGISVALIGGPAYAPADDVAALFASLIILYNGWKLLMPPLQELMDVEQPDLIDKVRGVAAAVSGVREIEKLQARKSGTRYWVDMHMEVDPQMTVDDAHSLAHTVKDAVREAIPAVVDVLIHIEPYRGPTTSQT